jgi:hypothetical protein
MEPAPPLPPPPNEVGASTLSRPPGLEAGTLETGGRFVNAIPSDWGGGGGENTRGTK